MVDETCRSLNMMYDMRWTRHGKMGKPVCVCCAPTRNKENHKKITDHCPSLLYERTNSN